MKNTETNDKLFRRAYANLMDQTLDNFVKVMFIKDTDDGAPSYRTIHIIKYQTGYCQRLSINVNGDSQMAILQDTVKALDRGNWRVMADENDF